MSDLLFWAIMTVGAGFFVYVTINGHKMLGRNRHEGDAP